jgi:hypothetical protein
MKATDVLYRAVPASPGPASSGARSWARVIASILACVTLAASRAHGQSTSPTAEPIQLAAIELATTWLGRAPALPHGVDVDVARPWPRLPRDRSYERRVIARVFHRMWERGAAPLNRFEEALAVYTGTRAIHELLEERNFEVVRFFGGLVPFPLRSVLLSPPVADPRPRVWRFDELPADADVLRTVRGLQTLERYVGWPAMAQALATMRAGGHSSLDADVLAATLSAVRGADLGSLVHECFRSDAVFDYAITNVQSPSSGVGLFETSLTITRLGSGIFEVAGEGDRERSMPVLVRFADGTEIRDWFDGAATSTTLVYTATSPVASAAIDPELMLLLDVNRANNSFTTTSPIRPLGVRLALSWMAWLQHTMLSYSALV